MFYNCLHTEFNIYQPSMLYIQNSTCTNLQCFTYRIQHLPTFNALHTEFNMYQPSMFSDIAHISIEHLLLAVSMATQTLSTMTLIRRKPEEEIFSV